MKLTKAQKALITLIMSERGKSGARKRWESMTEEQKQLHMQRMREGKLSKQPKGLTN